MSDNLGVELNRRWLQDTHGALLRVEVRTSGIGRRCSASRQFGTEDRGWVAHFLIRAVRGEPITLYGDGRKVRDLLFVDDLVDGMQLGAPEHRSRFGPGVQDGRWRAQHDESCWS